MRARITYNCDGVDHLDVEAGHIAAQLRRVEGTDVSSAIIRCRKRGKRGRVTRALLIGHVYSIDIDREAK